MAPGRYATDPEARKRIKELEDEIAEIKRIFGERLDMHCKEIEALKKDIHHTPDTSTVGPQPIT